MWFINVFLNIPYHYNQWLSLGNVNLDRGMGSASQSIYIDGERNINDASLFSKNLLILQGSARNSYSTNMSVLPSLMPDIIQGSSAMLSSRTFWDDVNVEIETKATGQCGDRALEKWYLLETEEVNF